MLERARILEPVGAGMGLAPNALHALDAIGLGEEVRRFSSSIVRVGSAAPAAAGWSGPTWAPWPTGSAIRS